MFTFVGITLAVLLMIACWLEARDRQRHTNRRQNCPDERTQPWN